jgi:hypothetical protein
MSDENPIYGDAAQAVIDRHLQAIVDELGAAGIVVLGVVAGVLHAGETSVNWCVAEDARDAAGEPVPAGAVVRAISEDVEAASREAAD